MINKARLRTYAVYLSVEASPCSHAAPSRGGAAPAPAHVISGQNQDFRCRVLIALLQIKTF